MKSMMPTYFITAIAALLTLAPLPAGAAGAKKLLLFSKDPATWSIAKGASGRLNYHEGTGAYTLQATGLPPRASYALIRYVDAGRRGEILARGASSGEGRLELRGVWRNWTGKFWVVCGEDVGGSAGASASLRAWRPEHYLFEEKVLGVPCNCPELEDP